MIKMYPTERKLLGSVFQLVAVHLKFTVYKFTEDKVLHTSEVHRNEFEDPALN